MTFAPTDFYQPGGTLPKEALSYVRRQADDQLYNALLEGEFCYILTPRQMGKSSLMAHTAKRLQDAGVSVAVIDLSSIGYELDAEQWYNGLIDQLGRRLRLEDELEELTLQEERLSPLQRWHRMLRDGVLEQCSGQVVIFLDEIDIVRSLPFSTDEFFAAIRACYNARTEDPAYERLTFCLLGVASPADLIRNPRLTPFNIGRRIQLNDFTAEEASQLQVGLGHDLATNRLLMERIYFWTGGHPCLTQRLCKAVAEDSAILTGAGVDHCCRQLFFSTTAEYRDDNLLFVQQRLLPDTEEERAALLTLYRQVWDGRAVTDNETVALVSQLKLSGVVRVDRGMLQVRNPIYARVFDRAWVTEHLPDAELRRQRAAYRRGVMRAAVASALLLAAIGTLAMIALIQFRRAEKAQSNANLLGKLAKQEKQYEDKANNLEYAADMNLIQQAYDNGDYGHVADLLKMHEPNTEDRTDRRDFAWRYYWQQMHQDRHTFYHPEGRFVSSVAYSPDGRTLASADGAGDIRLWDPTLWREKAKLIDRQAGAKEHGVNGLAFSPDGHTLASASEDHTVTLWDVSRRQVIRKLPHAAEVWSIAFSRDGKWLASGDRTGWITLWDLHTYRKMHRWTARRGVVTSVAFAPKSQWLAAGYSDRTVELYEIPDLRRLWSQWSAHGAVYSLTFSPDYKTLAVGTFDGVVELWNVAPWHQLAPLINGHKGNVNGIAFSPDGKFLATGSWDNTVNLWDVDKHKLKHTFIGHSNRVASVAFSPDGRSIASCGANEVKIWDTRHWEQGPMNRIQLNTTPTDKSTSLGSLEFAASGALQLIHLSRPHYELRLWDVGRRRDRKLVDMPFLGGPVYAFDGRTLATGYEHGDVILWDAASGRQLKTLHVDGRIRDYLAVGGLAFSPNSKMLAVASGEPARVTVWDLRSGRMIARFQHTNSPAGVAFSPNGQLLAAANWQGFVYVWDLSTNALVKKYRAHAKAVCAVCFSPDGNTLATLSEDRTVKLWNVATWREMVTFPIGSKGEMHSVVFSHDGKQLACQAGNTVWIWNAASWPEIKARVKSEGR